MIDPRTVDKLAFVHIMKTAGSYVDRYLCDKVLGRHTMRRWRNHVIKNSWRDGLDRDWTEDELRGFLALTDRRIYVHNHSVSWTEELIRDYGDAGYCTFSWVRHPGDALCSFYHWRIEQDGPPVESLDEFVRAQIDAGRPWEVPSWWELLDFVAPFSQAAFEAFLTSRFGVGVDDPNRVNKSANEGYDHYRETGEVSDETHELLEASRHMRIFTEICHRAG
ncbi:MAG: sulfotransferase family 2 domain-containing protein [Planctomycetes bacterium]|nr:sulfotransferase family 2 domain-containing protein [Planctomycetota bacterium]